MMLIAAAVIPTLLRLKRLHAIWRGLRPAIAVLAPVEESTSELRDMRATLYLRVRNSHLRNEITSGGPMINRKFSSLGSKIAVAGSTLALALTLTACGGSDEAAQVDDQSLVTTVEETAQASGGFDAPVVTPDKVSYTLSSPASFTPGKFASGMLPDQINERFNVTVENGSAADLDLATLIVKGSTTTGPCVDIFDGDNQMEGAPITPLAAGATANFSWGLSCPGKNGEDISVVLSNGTTNLIEVTGKLS
jgi:hypothetical protein